MKVKILLVIFVGLCIVMLSGCSSSQLENMNILTTYFADLKEEKIVIGGGVANVRTLSDSMAENPVSLVYAKGKNMAEAEDNLEKSADHPLFFGGVRAVVVGEELAKSGIYEFIESMRSDYKLRSESMFFITRSNPEDIVIHKAVNDFTGGFAAESLLKALEEEGKITYTTLSDVFENMCVKKAALAVACVNIDEDIMHFGGYAILKDGILKEFTDDTVNKGINIFLNKNASYDFYLNNKKYMVKKTGEHKKARLEGGRLYFDIEFEFEIAGDINEISDEILNTAKAEIEFQAKTAFSKAKNSGNDFLELYRIYQKDYRYEFESAAYENEFKNSEADIRIDIKA